MEATVYIDGVIVSQIPIDKDGNPVPGSFTTLAMVRDQLEWRKPYDSVKAIINSPGGELSEGFGIYDLLVSQPVPVTTVALGQCSSIATAIFLAGATRLIHEHTEFHVHMPAGGVEGTADAVKQYADYIARAQQQLIDCYVTRAGVAEEVITPLMAAETTMPPAQVRELGFATAIIQPVTALATVASPTPAPKTAVTAKHLMTEFQKMLAKLGKKITAMAETSAITALAVTTSGGDTLNVETGDRDTYAEGDAVTTADGSAQPDGDVTLSDGTILTIAGGKITKVAQPASASKDGDETSMALLTAVTALTDKVTALVTDVASIKAAQTGTATAVRTITAKYDAIVASTATGGKAPKDAGDDTAGAKSDQELAEEAAQRRADRRKASYGKPR